MKKVIFTFESEVDYATFIKEAVEAVKPEVGTVTINDETIEVHITDLLKQ